MGKLWWMNIKLGVWMAIRWHMIWYNVHWCHLVFLFPLHASVLEPKISLLFLVLHVLCLFPVQSLRTYKSQLLTYQILICRSVKQSAWAISILRRRVKYRLKWNSFSSSSVWYLVYDVRWRLVSPLAFTVPS